MRALDNTIASLGPPVVVRPLASGKPEIGFVARWRHGAAEIEIAPSRVVHLVMSLVDGRNARSGAGGALADRVRGGSISLFAPSEGARVTVGNEADVLQFFVRQDYVEALTGESLDRRSIFGLRDPSLRSLLIQTFVGSVRSSPDCRLALDETLQALVEKTGEQGRERFGSPAARPRYASGGLAPAALRRVDATIEAAVQDGRSLALADLAAAAGTSVTHFARTYRRETGTTPYRQLTGRRIERAVSLLRDAAIPIAEVADRTGFSSPAHFVAAFRGIVGTTPGAVRDALSA